ncbi:YVTN family beta-propeller repeat protein, partial [Pseudomonas sp. 1152_12]|uniref:YVTN family beta-propeller repeat protein n=1 Tax=Pseudomonas sp. 1152_12 TaxID=2604455 RepID=UPI004062C5C1
LSYWVTVGGTTVQSEVQVLTFQAQGAEIIETLNVGQGPHSVCVTNDGKRAFVTCRDSNSISVIDIKTRSVINTIFGVPMAFDSVLSPDNKRLYVSNYGSRSYTVIDTATYQTIMTVQIAGGDDVSGLAISADGLRLFVACTRNALVSVHDTATGTSINRITVTRAPVAMAINREQTQVFISSYLEVGIVNASGRSGLVGRIPGTNRPVQMVFGPDSGTASRVYVTDVDNILVIDPAKNVVIKKIPGVRYAWGAALNPNARELWVGAVGPGGSTAYRDSVFIINVDTDQIIRRLTGFENAASIAFVPNTRLALIANQASNTVSFIPT